MKGKQFTLLLLVSLLSIISFCQFTLHGKISDARTKESLMNASVFCQNTTFGTFTDQRGEFSLRLKPGGYNLIISHSGYRTQSIAINASQGPLVINLEKETIQLGEVAVKAKSNIDEDGWNNYGNFFVNNFKGTTPNAEHCQLQIPEALRFYFFAESNKLKVFASVPLKIKNKALGYFLSYTLDSFVLYFNDAVCSYQGNCLFTEMEGNDHEKKKRNQNRKNAYDGSVLHFMRSYYEGKLLKPGWDLGLQNKDDINSFDRIANPQDSDYYRRDIKNNYIEVFFPRRIKITYQKKPPEPEYLALYVLPKKITTQESAADLKEKIVINQNGFYWPQMAWITYNYWSWKNVTDLLPYDYSPD